MVVSNVRECHRFPVGRTRFPHYRKDLTKVPNALAVERAQRLFAGCSSPRIQLDYRRQTAKLAANRSLPRALTCSPPKPEATTGVRRMALRTRAEPKNRPQSLGRIQ